MTKVRTTPKRPRTVNVKLTDEEIALWRIAATAQQTSLVEWVRHTMNALAKKGK